MSHAKQKRKPEAEDRAEIDLTPMLDVVFIMLIFFIVTASFVKESSINVNVPESNENPPPPTDENPNILVQVNANDEIYIDQRRVDVRSVRSLLAQKHAEKPEGAVIVRAHEKSTAQTYVAIADAANEAKVSAVSLVAYND